MKKNCIGIASLLGALSLSLSFANAAQAQCRASDVALRQRGDIAIDAQTGTILYASNENERFYQASLTKRMTLLLALRAIENGTLTRDQMIQLPRTAFRNAYGEAQRTDPIPYEYASINVGNAIIAMNVRSSNRAPYGLATAISGSEENFVRLMNQTAASLGMTNTHFANSNGFPVRDVMNRHYTTASDHAKLVQALYREFPAAMEELNVGRARLEAFNASGRAGIFTVETTNRLMPDAPGDQALPNVVGGKTGYACAAGPSMDVEAMIDDRLVIIVSGGHDSAANRNNLLYNLIRYPSEQFRERLSLSRFVERAREESPFIDGLFRPFDRNNVADRLRVSIFDRLGAFDGPAIPAPLPFPGDRPDVSAMPLIIDRPRYEPAPWQPDVF